MRVKRALAICTVGMLVFAVRGQIRQAEGPSLANGVLERQVQGDDLEYLTSTDAFYAALDRTHSAGGVVRIITCADDTFKRPWRPSGSSLRLVLDAIVAADSRYEWRIEGAVINFIPVAREPALLGIRVNKFHAKDVTSARVALRQLLALAEVRKGMDELDLKQGVALINSWSSPHPASFSVHSKDVTLRQALNEIARAQGTAIWEYTEIHCQGRNEVVIRF